MGIVRTTGQENDLYCWGLKWAGQECFCEGQRKGHCTNRDERQTRTSAVRRDNKDYCLEIACGNTVWAESGTQRGDSVRRQDFVLLHVDIQGWNQCCSPQSKMKIRERICEHSRLLVTLSVISRDLSRLSLGQKDMSGINCYGTELWFCIMETVICLHECIKLSTIDRRGREGYLVKCLERAGEGKILWGKKKGKYWE